MNSSFGCYPDANDVFGPSVVGCRDGFDFTIAFEQYFYSLAPSVLLLLVAPWRLQILSRMHQKVNGNGLRLIKMSAIAVFAVLQLTLIILWATNSDPRAQKPSLAASVISFATTLVICALSALEHSKSLRPSFLLQGYLLLTIIFDAALLRTLWLIPSFNSSIRDVHIATMVIKSVILVLEAKEKRSYNKSKYRDISPEEYSGLYNQSVLWWLNRLIWQGARHVLRPRDLYPLTHNMTADALGPRFWSRWTKCDRTTGGQLLRELIKLLGSALFAPVMPRVALISFTLCQPLLLKRLLQFLTSEDQHVRIGYGLIGAYGVVYLGIGASSALYWHRHYRFLVMLRGTLITAIFRKATELNIAALDSSTSVTLMSTDVERIVRGLLDIHEFWANIIQVGICAWLIQIELGLACLVPIGVALIAFGITIWLSTFTTAFQMKWVTKIEERLGFTTSMLGAMRYIKLSGLAPKVGPLLERARVREVRAAGQFRLLSAVSVTLANVPLLISPVITFAVYTAIAVKHGTTLDATRLFTALSLLLLLSEPLFNVFGGLIDFMSAIGCLRRIDAFLTKPSRVDNRRILQSSAEQGTANSSEPEVACISIEDGYFGWAQDREPILKAVDITIPRGQFTLISSPVASGKSTLLKGILGEVPLAKGTIRLSRKDVAFCDQSAWLTNASLRNNIIGVSTFDADLYAAVIHCCDLASDLEQLPGGDQTIVGSKGFALSGGQKQRIGIARAAYARKELAIFDDVLSALDMATQNRIFQRLFGPKGLLRRLGTTAVLATHANRFLPHADHVIVLGEGKVLEQGPYMRLTMNKDLAEAETSEASSGQVFLDSEDNDELPSQYSPHEGKAQEVPLDKSRQLGDFQVYRYYFAALSWAVAAIFFVLQISWAFLSCFPTIWLKWWTDDNARHPNERNAYYIGVYTALQVVGLISSGLVTWWSFNIMAVNTGVKLHEILARAVMSAPMIFFSSTDSGSILTRFSQDIQLLDMSLPLALQVVVTNMLICIAQIGLIASASAWIVVSFPLLLATFYLVQKYYLRTSRQMRLLDLEQKAPLYTQFVETLDGLATVRAFSWQQNYINRNHELVDGSQKPFYLMYMIQRWLALVLDLIIGSLAVLVVGIAVALRDSVSPGFTGVSLTQIISFTAYLKLMIMFWTQMETSIGAVARIRQFNTDTPNENLPDENSEPSSQWPDEGRLRISNLSASYSEDAEKMTLSNINIVIEPGQKIGICGRTGSGKSSLMLTLFRLLDLKSGKIEIDGIDISKVLRDTVRSRLISIAEEPFYLPGTIRDNVDPYGRTTDEEMIEVLKKSMIWDTVLSKGGLDAELDSAMFSHGQRQLFGIARALLRRDYKVLVLDEATSSVDSETDKVIQDIIRAEFKHHTIISVAHRLETILDFDRIAVMDHGRVVEYDSPSALMANQSIHAPPLSLTHPPLLNHPHSGPHMLRLPHPSPSTLSALHDVQDVNHRGILVALAHPSTHPRRQLLVLKDVEKETANILQVAIPGELPERLPRCGDTVEVRVQRGGRIEIGFGGANALEIVAEDSEEVSAFFGGVIAEAGSASDLVACVDGEKKSEETPGVLLC
ncbi:putative multidrug resistance protein [Bimuria novae-zelandiae CBS 107.79]|uniref:Putative multidrug resistance protein n=1 Tax=Bimuria novae-zelandiae CBS 107.79 TaxID=1447943 RepID=A0A6A5V894_9PLEO|nr:putative multidrug resistance protein [Bimuria novae-zelandiae CBS 107.79]